MPERRTGLLAVTAAGLLGIAAPAGAGPALWSVSDEDNTIYLFGSVHVLPQGGFRIEGPLAEAWRDVQSVCLEIDSSATSPEEMTGITLARAVDPDGRSLFDLLGADAADIRERAARAGVDLAPYAPFEPWFVGIAVTLAALQQHGFQPDHGVEEIIQQKAAGEGKAACGLETVDEQLGILDGFSAELQRELLLQSIDEVAGLDEEMSRLVAGWRAGDERELERMLREDLAEYPELAERLVYERNARWADKIAAMLDGDEDRLIVVGAMHLVGDRGLPRLLERRGFRVERR